AGDRGPAGRHLRPGRDTAPQALPRDRPRSLRDRGLGTSFLPSCLHRRPRPGIPAGPGPARGGGGGVHHRRAALRVAEGAGDPRRSRHRRERPALAHSRRAAAVGGRRLRSPVRSARDRAPAPPAPRGLLDEEPGVLDREGAPPARVRAEDRPRGGLRPDRRLLPGGGVALSDRAARIVLGVVVAGLVAAALAIDLPRLSGGQFWSDGATYHAMAWSLAEDFDLRYEARDVFRIRREFPAGPQGLFLKRTDGGLHRDPAAGFPGLRWGG